MPTYQNVSGQPVTLSIGRYILSWRQGETKEVDYLINDSRLTLIIDTPYVNDALGSQQVTSSGPGDDKTIELNIDTDSVDMVNSSTATITVFRQSLSNTPGIPVVPGSILELSKLKDRTSLIILQFSAAVSNGVWCTQFRG